ncbi:hypothetical protein ACYVVD_02665 [Arenicellales bacterium IMCC58067]
MKYGQSSICVAAALFATFAVFFYFGPFAQFNSFTHMPGDLGDARLNNYFLENIYQFFFGSSESLVELPFLYPFPKLLGFSENLFGASPVYMTFRLLGYEADRSFQIWYMLGYAANYTAAYFALRVLKLSWISACLGAVIFSFALPVTAHMGHPQLQYRFGVPLALAFYLQFWRRRNWDQLLSACFWTIWQFFCSIYIGFFLVVVLFSSSVVLIGTLIRSRSLLNELDVLWKSWISINGKVLRVLLLLIMAGAFFLLFVPYLQVSELYGFQRTYDEIASMLPRLSSLLIAQHSWIWAGLSSRLSAGIPMLHEHQMFIGIVPAALAIGAILTISAPDRKFEFYPMLGALVIPLFLTLSYGGWSVWYLISNLPLASAIRAVTRIDLVLLFPAAYFASHALESIWKSSLVTRFTILAGIATLMVVEFSAVSAYVTPLQSWRDRASKLEESVTYHFDKDAILFLAQNDDVPWYVSEADIMLFAQQKGLRTMNGYSGNIPHADYTMWFGKDCAEYPRRILSYIDFSSKSSGVTVDYSTVASKIVPIGFTNCAQSWRELPPQYLLSQ